MAESILRQEMANSSRAVDKSNLKFMNITVVFPNETQYCFKLDKQAIGQTLLDKVFQHLELIEKDYFGLQFTKNMDTPYTANPDVLRWVNPNKSIKKQMKGKICYFCVKLYAPDPRKLQDDHARYYLYLQLRKDLLNGKLYVSSNRACLLASYIAQSELGNYNIAEHKLGYLSNLALIPGQTIHLEKYILEFHKLHKGVSQLEAKKQFLDLCKQLNMYGINLHKAKDSNDKELEIGVNSNGLVVHQNNIRINTLLWNKIIRLSFKKKKIIVHLQSEMLGNDDTILDFNMTYHGAKNFWKSCKEHYSFFRLNKPIICTTNRGGLKKFLFGPRTGTIDIEYLEETLLSYEARLTNYRRNSSKTLFMNKTQSNKFNSVAFNDSHNQQNPLVNVSQDIGDMFLIENEDESTKYIIHDELSNYMSDIPAYDTEPCLGSIKNVVCIHLNGDSRGRFGFNVTGGFNYNLPITVSDVAPNTAASRSILSEGDEILMMDAQEVGALVNNDVWNILRAARDMDNNQLTLTVVQTGHEKEDMIKNESFIQYKPEFSKFKSSTPLIKSILLLEEGLRNESIITQFEKLYKHKPDTSVDNARTTRNKYKNRYRDTLAYDSTRFIFKGQDNDYINANYINMSIPGSGIVNRYIATQAPLQTTVNDFWNMVYESQSSIIVMANALIEKGHKKCFKYWPTRDIPLIINDNLRIRLISEEIDRTNIIVYRKMELTELTCYHTRLITQIQYNIWPDHGVPLDSKCLLNLVGAIRKQRIGVLEPIIIHCTAGVGQTGVIILLETALCLVEASQPVFPLEIVKQMRVQRPMMIQTSNQYKFVCHCIHYAFTRGLVKPKYILENSE